MPGWSAKQYLAFGDERTQPCRDLAARVPLERPAAVIDLGCGPGNSTAVLAARWPDASITGLDSSPEMIAAAKREYPDGGWQLDDIAFWADSETRRFDVVFSNAALQWTGDHATLFPKLFERVEHGGVFAAQLPSGRDMEAHSLMRGLAVSAKWSARIGPVADWHTEDIGLYYDVLSPIATRVDLWETEYVHVLESAEDIVQWYRGTGLRPFLQALATDAERAEFEREYLEAIRPHYAKRRSGKVLFPFRRVFMIAAR
jgi:trans-aconitate 2-methyltransferase